jgi:conjugal transfer ATP-binding protein TraC
MYEIPQQLEYKEKIIFGLTFGQLFYALIFFPVAFFFFFRLNANLVVRVFLTFIPISLASGFIFFDLSGKMKMWSVWYKNRLVEGQKIKELYNIKEVQNGLIITEKKKLAVLKIEPVNFIIKPKGEQEAIILSFQKFLNSLDFPIQFLMTTNTLNLEDYLSELKSKITSEKESIFQEYQAHLKKLIKDNSVMNRNFYLIIPENHGLEIQLKICEERLNTLNLKTTSPTKEEILDLIYGGHIAKRIENGIDTLKIDKSLNRVVYAHGYPRIVESGFLDRMVSCQGNFDLSLHIEPYSLENTIVALNRELQKQRADLYSAKLKHQFNPSLEIKYEDTRKTLENLQKGQEKLFNVSFYINCRAEDKKELDLLTNKIESELNSLLILPKKALFRMLQGFKACLPIADNTLKAKRNITTSALSAFFPFTSSFFKFDKTGIWFGLNKNKIPIIRDIFKLSNANGICLATSGSGKSYMAKLFISRYLFNGTKVIVIDPQSEYTSLVERFNGQRIDLSRTSTTIINPLDLMGHEYPEKRLALMDLMPVMLGELTEPQKSFIDKALTIAYETKGIEIDKPETWGYEPPILEDVLKSLVKLEKGAILLEKSTIRSLINRLDIYVNGVFSFLNRQSKINFGNRFVCFDIGNMPKQIKPTIMFLVLDYVYMKMKKDLERKLLVIDEAWALLSRTEDASYIFEIVKTCRKFNLGLFLINQEVEGMLESQAGRSVLANISYTLLLKQKPAVIESIQKTFFLSNSERTSLLTAGVGEGLLIMENEHSEIKIVSSEAEHNQITTNADELLANNENGLSKSKQELSKQPKAQKLKPKVVNISVDPEKGFFKHKDLTFEEVKYLINKKYRIYSFYSIISGKKENFVIRPRFNESPQHCFLTFELAEYLRKFADKVYLYQTKKPDIVFELKGKKFAIEVETGKILKNSKKKIQYKSELLNKEYGEDWCFVVTNRNLTKDYKKYGETLTKLTVINQLKKIYKKAKVSKKSTLKNSGKKAGVSSVKSLKNPISTPAVLDTSTRSPPFARSVKVREKGTRAKVSKKSKRTKLKVLKGGDESNGKRKNKL